MKLRNKLLALCIAILLLVPYITPVVIAVENSENSISIGTAEEFETFARNCSLDTWSKGKTVTLTQNINIKECDVRSVPIFAGTFNGGGFMISGVELTAEGSQQGLFRYIQEGAVVKDLTVVATVTPEGESDNLGGIAGSNSGTIQGCVFNGMVIGGQSIGGIAGTNEEKGKIIDCTSKGFVNGVIYVGGAAGSNFGEISGCTNEAAVGTSPREGGSTDIGGIVGYSSGTVKGCTNNAIVGTRHKGYNIGGIAGSQEGTISDCVNKGEVYGRKDVGGIVGQMEPSIKVIFTDDILEKLNTELTKLYNMIKGALADSDKLSADTLKRLDNASKYINTASSSTNSLLSQLSSAVNSGGNNLNTSTSIIYSNVGNYSVVLQDISSCAEELVKQADNTVTAVTKMSSISGMGAASASKSLQAAKDMKSSIGKIEEALTSIEGNVSALRSAVLKENETDMSTALTSLTTNVTSLGDNFKSLASNVDSLKTNIAGLMSSDKTNQKTAQTALGDIKTNLNSMASGISAIAATLKKVEAKTEVNWTELKANMKSMSTGAKDTGTASGKVQTALNSLAGATDKFTPGASGLADPVDKLTDAAKDSAAAFKDMSTAFSKIQSYMNELSEADPTASAEPLGSSYNSQSQALYRAVVSLSSELSGLSSDMSKENAENSKDMNEINTQLYSVMQLVVEALKDSDKSGEVKDVSDNNVTGAESKGKVSGCTNSGIVTGDKDIGGIAGVMSIENDYDPEDEQNDTLPSDVEYEIMAVISACLNEGEIESTGDCTGGIVGRMDVGTVISSESYGHVNSTADYTGGVAGYSETSVRKSYAKCIVNGDSFTGGIVGSGSRIDSCGAIVLVNGSGKYAGAIAGYGDMSDKQITNNVFLDNGVAAIDGVSYHTVAEPLSLGDLQARSDLPSGFATFTVTCIADGEVVEEVEVPFEEELASVELPEVPEKEGLYGYWSDFDTKYMQVNQKVYATYGDWITMLSSMEMDNGRAFVLAEGQFTNKAVLHVCDSEETAPSSNTWAVWDIDLSGTELEEDAVVPIRLLNLSGDPAAVWQLMDGEWVKLPTKQSGQYLLTTMAGTSGIFCIRADYTVVALIIAILAVTAICAIVAAIVLNKSEKNKKKPQPKAGKEPIPAEPLNEDELLPKDWQLPMEDVTEPQPKDEIPIETAEIPIIPEIESHASDDTKEEASEKKQKLSYKEKSALKRRQKCEARRAKRVLEQNREYK